MKVKSIGMVFLLTVLFLSCSSSSSSINQALMSKLRSEPSISREFVSHLKTEYNASSGLLVLHSPCKVLVQENARDQFVGNIISNQLKSLQYELNCSAMISRASVIAKTISGVKSVDVLR